MFVLWTTLRCVFYADVEILCRDFAFVCRMPSVVHERDRISDTERTIFVYSPTLIVDHLFKSYRKTFDRSP